MHRCLAGPKAHARAREERAALEYEGPLNKLACRARADSRVEFAPAARAETWKVRLITLFIARSCIYATRSLNEPRWLCTTFNVLCMCLSVLMSCCMLLCGC